MYVFNLYFFLNNIPTIVVNLNNNNTESNRKASIIRPIQIVTHT